MLSFYKKFYSIKKIYSFLPLWSRLGYRKYSSVRKLIRETEFKSKDELDSFQFEHLKSIVNHAWDNIPGYKHYWESNGFNPAMLKSLEDIKLIPIIDKELIRNNLEDFSYKGIGNLTKLTTGGSTGIPFVFYNYRDLGLTELAFIHDLWSRVYPKANLNLKSTILRGRQLKDVISFDPMLGLILSSYELTTDNVRKYTTAIDKYKTPIFQSYPSSLYVFASALENMNISLNHHFEAIVLGSEVLYDFQREQIQRVFNTKISHWYGHGERAVLAGNCEHNDALHAYPQYGVLEIVDKDGKEVTQGNTGEIIGTGFWNYATPFIRYRTMDLAEKGAGYCSKCGRNYQLINKIIGRDHEFVVSKQGKLVALTGVSLTCGTFNQVTQFRFFQDTPGHIVFKYIKKFDIQSVDEDLIRRALLEKLGHDFEISFAEVNIIERTSRGKFMYLDQKIDIKNIIGH